MIAYLVIHRSNCNGNSLVPALVACLVGVKRERKKSFWASGHRECCTMKLNVNPIENSRTSNQLLNQTGFTIWSWLQTMFCINLYDLRRTVLSTSTSIFFLDTNTTTAASISLQTQPQTCHLNTRNGPMMNSRPSARRRTLFLMRKSSDQKWLSASLTMTTRHSSRKWPRDDLDITMMIHKAKKKSSKSMPSMNCVELIPRLYGIPRSNTIKTCSRKQSKDGSHEENRSCASKGFGHSCEETWRLRVIIDGRQ